MYCGNDEMWRGASQGCIQGCLAPREDVVPGNVAMQVWMGQPLPSHQPAASEESHQSSRFYLTVYHQHINIRSEGHDKIIVPLLNNVSFKVVLKFPI